jgi:hypothetical protein
MFPGAKGLIPIIATAIIISCCKYSIANKFILSNKLIVSIGLISYPMYLWHWPIFSSYLIVNQGIITYTDKFLLLGLIILLSIVSFKYIEKPIRYNTKFRIKKTLILFFIIILIGITGFLIYKNKGLPNRTSLVNHSVLFNDKNSSLIDIKCPDTLVKKLKYNEFTLCRASDNDNDEIVAIYGDSHAYRSFSGISKVNSRHNIGTLAISRTANYVPFVGLYDYIKPNYQKQWDDSNNIIISVIVNNDKIKKVFIIARGMIYLNGIDIDYNKISTNYPIPVDLYRKSIQLTVDIFIKAGKKVYIVAETPVLPININHLLRYYSIPNETFLKKNDVIAHQRPYMEVLSKIKNATIIYSVDTFCPNDMCLITDNLGKPLYTDDDHLSYYGSKFQAENLLSNYLDK